MSSYVMHICISNIVKRKLNLTDKFIYGSVLPDVIKILNNDRQGTHYLKEIVVDGKKRNLPEIDKAIKELNISDKEIKLGYIAHLVEDFIWFNKYLPSFAKKVDENKIVYLDGSIHTEQEFRNDIYSDYTNSNKYIASKCNTDIEELKTSLETIVMDNSHKKLIHSFLEYMKESDVTKIKLMTKESIDEYIDESAKEVEKIVLELIGE